MVVLLRGQGRINMPASCRHQYHEPPGRFRHTPPWSLSRNCGSDDRDPRAALHLAVRIAGLVQPLARIRLPAGTWASSSRAMLPTMISPGLAPGVNCGPQTRPRWRAACCTLALPRSCTRVTRTTLWCHAVRYSPSPRSA